MTKRNVVMMKRRLIIIVVESDEPLDSMHDCWFVSITSDRPANIRIVQLL